MRKPARFRVLSAITTGTDNSVGYGNLAYPCHVKHFNAQGQLDNSCTACESGFTGFQGGQSGGGGASGSW